MSTPRASAPYHYLEILPVHLLKIYGDFVSAPADDETDRLIVRSIAQPPPSAQIERGRGDVVG